MDRLELNGDCPNEATAHDPTFLEEIDEETVEIEEKLTDIEQRNEMDSFNCDDNGEICVDNSEKTNGIGTAHSETSSEADETMVYPAEVQTEGIDQRMDCDFLLAGSLMHDQLYADKSDDDDRNSISSGMSSPDEMLDMDISSACSSPPTNKVLVVTNPTQTKTQTMITPTDEGFDQDELLSTVQLIDNEAGPSTSYSIPTKHLLRNQCVLNCDACSLNFRQSGPSKSSTFVSRPHRLLIGGKFGGLIAHQLIYCNDKSSKTCTDYESMVCSAFLTTSRDYLTEDDFNSLALHSMKCSPMQIPPSDCGVVAILDILCSLRFPVIPIDQACREIANLLNPKQRVITGSIGAYLLSRSAAGSTHSDLLRTVQIYTDHGICGRFFPASFVDPHVGLVDFIANWIRMGVAPVLTLNPQREIDNSTNLVSDAWHHQLVMAIIGPNDTALILDHPWKVVDERRLRVLLGGPSTLLVRSSDLAAIWNRDSSLELIRQRSLGDQRWTEMNVIGQVVAAIRQANESSYCFSGDNRAILSHISIPAVFSPGISLFARRDSNQWRLIQAAPSLS